MSFLQYMKERWITYLFLFVAFSFSLIVYKLDVSLYLSQSSGSYILVGWGILFTIFVTVDYFVLNYRLQKLEAFTNLNASSEEVDEFIYPLDNRIAKQMESIILKYEKYRSDIRALTSEEMTFITKWLHDVKVPISASKLILETEEQAIPKKLYERLYHELFSIEESAQRVFYEMKTNRFYDDYKIAPTQTKKLIASALKGYSSFFSYKKLAMNMEGEDTPVLTDEKWSGYILSQIISNAVKYTPENGRISIKTMREDSGDITISIRNSGQGIHPSDIGQVFKKGYTSSERRTGLKATGYGLYLAKKLSDLLGHTLTVKSVYNEYAEFHLQFHENKTIYDVTKL
ncbi:sensor histidine kinase [Evansella cellulosilytica]|uniref:histidine kinase n=1 Tax=Evansella cellulosilytica (strain ATCC 21833 / DSM 2522 / FERM P-1141 / JCM 9156 / N-4) TaxID=649639 RepID=E6TYF9_EVAC2|nr:sensor histidine kinase [Evansella cellulosilytica]ADU28897.1 integral membrane sensor signal transduction histidine kinase [Evansella cellulosilytica DSM 2522]